MATIGQVTRVSSRIKQGLFNPFTLSGTIVVNGVVASVHSEWLLDDLVTSPEYSRYLPIFYQVCEMSKRNGRSPA